MKSIFKGWWEFGKLGIRFLREFLEDGFALLMWLPCFIFYPIAEYAINITYHRKPKR